MIRRRIFLALTILWLLLIWAQSVLPADLSREESGKLLALLQGLLPWLTSHILRKAAHFTEYAILGALLFGAAEVRHGLCFPPLFGLLAALLDESIQLLSDGRAGMISDVWLDLAGFLLGWLILLLLFWITQSIRKRHQSHG